MAFTLQKPNQPQRNFLNVSPDSVSADPTVLWGEPCQLERDRSGKTTLDNVRGALSGSPLVSSARHKLSVSLVHVSSSPSLVKCEEGVAAVITPTRWELPKKKKKETDSDGAVPKDHSEVPKLASAKHAQQQMTLYLTVNKVCDLCKLYKLCMVA